MFRIRSIQEICQAITFIGEEYHRHKNMKALDPSDIVISRSKYVPASYTMQGVFGCRGAVPGVWTTVTYGEEEKSKKVSYRIEFTKYLNHQKNPHQPIWGLEMAHLPKMNPKKPNQLYMYFMHGDEKIYVQPEDIEMQFILFHGEELMKELVDAIPEYRRIRENQPVTPEPVYHVHMTRPYNYWP